MARTSIDASALVQRVRAPKPHVLLAEQLREAILSGELVEGQTLPPERELVAQSGLTRGAVRDALKTLSSEGLLHTQPGRFGGNIVTRPDREWVATSLNQFVRGQQLPIRALNETREVLEPSLARLAALHRSEEDLEVMRSHQQDMVDSTEFRVFSRANVKWHQAVARASHNDLLTAALEAIAHAISVSTSIDEFNTPKIRQAVLQVHARVMDAIAAQDPEQADRWMRKHITAINHDETQLGSSTVPLTDRDAARGE